MRRLLFLILIVVAVVALGAHRGWFHFASRGQDRTSNITMTVDKDKIREDKDKAVAKVQALGQEAKDKVAVTTQKE